mgnify:FL=1
MKKNKEKEKQFAEAMAITNNASDSAKKIGLSSSSSASMLRHNVNVQERIQNLRLEVEDNTEVSLQWTIEKYIDLFNVAKKKEDYSTARNCIDSITKVMDYLPKDKHTTNNSAIKFEVLLKQLESNDAKVIEHEPDN